MKHGGGVLALDRTPTARRVNLAVKAGLFGSFAIALTGPIDALEGKAMGLRAPLFLASAVLVPVIGRWRRWSPHAHVGDALLAAPFLLDTLGNILGVYDEYPVTDDVLHAANGGTGRVLAGRALARFAIRRRADGWRTLSVEPDSFGESTGDEDPARGCRRGRGLGGLGSCRTRP